MRAEQEVRHPTGEQRPPGHRFNGNGAVRQPAAAADDSAHDARTKPTERDALKLLLQQFAELREYASYYMAARIDGARASVRNAILRLVLAALGVIAVAGIIVMASGFVLHGLAQGLGTLFGGREWMGTLFTGLAALVGIGVGIRYMLAALANGAQKRTVSKYEERQAQQRTRFGRDIQDRKPTGVVGSE